ncbi:hypothetical protein [Paucibacter sp. Y2R2-4]|uniref:hypothetical protein n=1 Tax=Paucibacter sp. Y2R2-4 TaxID=2893553 RepID=UPI0021E46189|nr:hypothetical protein [Paucibacter sp. Y2R2-4]MCV2349268.1 hypothetical protein [Paucibacter sp. Y2R2-4]
MTVLAARSKAADLMVRFASGIKFQYYQFNWGQFFWLLAAMFVAVVCGMAVPIFGVIVPALVSAVVVSLVVLAASPLVIVWMMMILVYLVVGQLTFFAGISQAAWLPYLALLLIALKYLMEQFGRKAAVSNSRQKSALPVLLLLFVLFFFASAYLNKSGLSSTGVAAKNYVFPWFLTLLVWQCIKSPEDLRSMWRFMLWLVVIQVPFALVQHFYFAKQSGASWDAVVGTFGGNFLRGGSSGAMAIFIAFALLLSAAMYRAKQLKFSNLAVLWLAGLATIALAEVKIFFLVLPLGMVLLFRRELIARPFASLVVASLLASLLSALVWIYQQGYSETISGVNTTKGLLEYSIGAEKDPYFFNPITKETSRASAIWLWNRHNRPDDHQYYIGHGAAASRASATLGQGVAAKKYPFTLTTSSASTMLWDGGLVTLALFGCSLLTTGLGAFRLARWLAPFERAALEAVGVTCLLSIPLLFYNRDAIDGASTQTLLAFFFGYYLLCLKSVSKASNLSTFGHR